MQPLPLLKDTEVVQEKADRDLLTPLYTEEALRFLDGVEANPFFLYLAFSYPHDPAKASPRFRGKSGFGDFGDAVMEIDWSAGEVLKKLHEKGLDSDTVVFFTSDHGPWFQGSPGTLRGRKGSTFEGGFRVPLLARWPGQIPASRVVNEWGSNLDFVPTLSSLCGLTLPKLPIDGVSIAPLLLGQQETEVKRPPVLYFSPLGQKGEMVHCIREGSWKLRVAQAGGEIYINDHGAPQESGWLPHPELYNLALDPEESYDVAGQNQERVAHMLASLEAQLSTFPEDTQAAYRSLKENVAAITMPPAAALRRRTSDPQPDWAWEPEDHR
jgi:arylsulfatase